MELKLCKGQDRTALDETITGHKFHCPFCNVHLTAQLLCSKCGTLFEETDVQETERRGAKRIPLKISFST